MKRLSLFLIAMLAVSFSLKAQQYVSTTPANRNVILEEFTGRNCGYCPDGHRIANEIMAAHPGRVWAINIHAGGYAPTTYPNFNTPDGSTIHSGFSISGYPTGVVNRSTPDGQSRSLWASLTNAQLGQSAECNIAGVVNIDAQTRVATINVEVYYTGNSTQSTNYLTVAMLQDSILGSQSGMNYNPSQIVNGQYCHMHVLRDVITDNAWGEAISPTTQGTLLTRTYTYNIPETIGSPNGVDVNLSHIFFLAWVSERYQGTPTRPILTACELENPNAPCYITTSSNPSNGGTTSGGGTYNNGQSCTLTATPASGCSFINWTKNGNVVSTNATYTFTVNGSGNYVANFNVPTYTITTSSNPSNGGTTSGGGTFEYGQSCTLHATANTGYTFVNWTKNGTQISTNANYTFTVTESGAYVANFEAQTFTVAVEASPAEGGTVSGGGTYNYGQSCTITATTNEGYNFLKWTRNGTQVSTNPSYTFTVTQNATYVAHFEVRSFYIALSANPSNGGAVSGGGMFNYGQTCTAHAEPAEHYAFTQWTDGGTPVSTEADYSFVVTGGRNLVGNFVRTYDVVAQADPEAGAVVTGSGTYLAGETVTVTCEPNENYNFINWTEDGIVVSEDLTYTFDAKECTIVAHLSYYDGLGEHNGKLLIYPNPVNDKLFVEANENINSLEIYNLAGSLVYSQNDGSNKVEIRTVDLPDGIYFIRLTTASCSEVRRFVKD